jgi:hypothetical protein
LPCRFVGAGGFAGEGLDKGSEGSVWLHRRAAVPALDVEVPEPRLARTQQLADAVLCRCRLVDGLGGQLAGQYLAGRTDRRIGLPQVLAEFRQAALERLVAVQVGSPGRPEEDAQGLFAGRHDGQRIAGTRLGRSAGWLVEGGVAQGEQLPHFVGDQEDQLSQSFAERGGIGFVEVFGR